MPPSDLPSDYHRIRFVETFEELVAARFADGVNALCWPRTLAGDFAEVVAAAGPGAGITSLDEARLRTLPLGGAGRAACVHLLTDLERLRAHGRAPVLDCIEAYPRDEDPGAVATDVYSFHADSAPVEADTFLCTYHGAATEGLRNDEALRRIDVPATRAELRREFGGDDDTAFQEYLHAACYDLHYAALPGARPFSFGVGHLWRIAVEHPGSAVPPCIHRAPANLPGDGARLLLIC